MILKLIREIKKLNGDTNFNIKCKNKKTVLRYHPQMEMVELVV